MKEFVDLVLGGLYVVAVVTTCVSILLLIGFVVSAILSALK